MFKSKQDEAPLGAHGEYDFLKGTDSPPSLSLTASPDKTTEKKLTNLVSLQEVKKAGFKQPTQQINFICGGCDRKHQDSFLPYTYDANFGNCEQCGNFQNLTALRLEA